MTFICLNFIFSKFKKSTDKLCAGRRKFNKTGGAVVAGSILIPLF